MGRVTCNGSVVPFAEHDDGSRWLYAFIYLFCLLHCFIGVGMAADVFMSAIELITAQRRRVPSGADPKRIVTVRVWNDTVANLTLLALGSSAPEILLAVVETVGNNFHAGSLGPSTIVGSAAFNLLVIVAVCIVAVPSTQTRKIKEVEVYWCTVVFQFFAYIWLWFIVSVSSPDIIDIWEGVATWGMMPVLVGVCFAVDAGLIAGMRGRRRKPEPPLLPSKTSDAAEEGRVRESLRNFAASASNGMGPDVEYTPAPASYSTRRSWSAPKVSVAQGRRASFSKRMMSQLEEEVRSSLRSSISREEAHGNAGDDMELVMDAGGQAIDNPNGVLSFFSDTMSVSTGSEPVVVQVVVHRCNGTSGDISCKYQTLPFGSYPGFDYIQTEGTVTFGDGERDAGIEITVLPKRPGERDGSFQLVLEDIEGGAEFDPNVDGGEDSNVLTICLVNGAPSSKRELLDWDLINMTTLAWKEQIWSAVTCAGDDDDNDEGDGEEGNEDESPVSLSIVFGSAYKLAEYPWAVLVAILSPPASLGGGWPLFLVALVEIAGITVLIKDFASFFGCCANIADSVTAITIVALGTSLPDMFASRASAVKDETADASIVNVTGSNSVNVFMGIGLPWTLAAVYWAVHGPTDLWEERYRDLDTLDGVGPDEAVFVVNEPALTFAVMVYTAFAICALVILRLRRLTQGGELGGHFPTQVVSALTMVVCWCLYVFFAILREDNYVDMPVAYALIALAVGAVFVTVCWEVAGHPGYHESPEHVNVVVTPPPPSPGGFQEQPGLGTAVWDRQESHFEVKAQDIHRRASYTEEHCQGPKRSDTHSEGLVHVPMAHLRYHNAFGTIPSGEPPGASAAALEQLELSILPEHTTASSSPATRPGVTAIQEMRDDANEASMTPNAEIELPAILEGNALASIILEQAPAALSAAPVDSVPADVPLQDDAGADSPPEVAAKPGRKKDLGKSRASGASAAGTQPDATNDIGTVASTAVKIRKTRRRVIKTRRADKPVKVGGPEEREEDGCTSEALVPSRVVSTPAVARAHPQEDDEPAAEPAPECASTPRAATIGHIDVASE